MDAALPCSESVCKNKIYPAENLQRKTKVTNACVTFIGANTDISRKAPWTTKMYHIFIRGGKRKMFEKEPDLLTRRQTQDLLHVSKNTILKMIHEGELPAIVVAGSYRIEKRNIIEYIRDSRRERCYF